MNIKIRGSKSKKSSFFSIKRKIFPKRFCFNTKKHFQFLNTRFEPPITCTSLLEKFVFFHIFPKIAKFSQSNSPLRKKHMKKQILVLKRYRFEQHLFFRIFWKTAKFSQSNSPLRKKLKKKQKS